MLFNSLHFLIFFPIVTAIYFFLPHRLRWIFILAASCYFYMVFIPKYILVLAFTILVDYVAGIFIERTEGRLRKQILIAGVIANLGMLAWFKYFNFANTNLAAMAELLGWNYPIANLAVILPIGLSFHTFQSVSYLLEVYHGRQAAERHFGYLSLFVMFFPQLVAGPIERPQHILPQLKTEQHFEYQRAADGIKWIAWGMFKKVVIADRLATLVNPVFGAPANYSGPAFAFAAIAFAIQIYCDFSGYSDMAFGSAQVLGIRLTKNFQHPYFAKSIPEFWQRWHISLSSWFRDYVFFPLRRSLLQRRNRLPDWMNRAIPTLVTMLLSGLWHGANWTFALWGLLHGVYIVLWESIERMWLSRFSSTPRFLSMVWNGLSIATTFLLVSFALIFFRSSNMADAIYIVTHLFAGWDIALKPLAESIAAGDGLLNGFFNMYSPVTTASRGILLLTSLALCILFIVEILQQRGNFLEQFNARPSLLRLAAYAILVTSILTLGAYAEVQQVFIYFQF